MTQLLKTLWNTNPINIFATIVAAEVLAVSLGYLPFSLVPTMLLVMGLAYLQNTAYGLQSRSAARNSNAYHLVAAVVANFTFFWSLQLLVRNNLPLVLLAPYVFATILGTLHANKISLKIESALGITTGDPKGKAQLLKLWPTVALLVAALIAQAIWVAPTYGRGVLVTLLVLAVGSSFAFSLLRVARSTDHYWFHLGAVILNLGVTFLQFKIMINNRYDWALFLPTTTGNVIGSLVGANFAQDIGKRIKSAFDAHVVSGVKIAWPSQQLGLLSFLLVIHLFVFGLRNWTPALILLGFSVWQAVSFTMVSRARQRNNAQYLAWTSVFSNGVWYLTMGALAVGGIGWDKALPYIVGNSGGSLIGQNLAMKTEQATGALMDQPAVPKLATA